MLIVVWKYLAFLGLPKTSMTNSYRNQNVIFSSDENPNQGQDRHGICHGHTNIVRVKFHLPWVKYSFGHTLIVVNSLLFAIFNSFFPVFFGPIKQKLRNIVIKVYIEVYKGNIGVKQFLLTKKVVIYFGV